MDFVLAPLFQPCLPHWVVVKNKVAESAERHIPFPEQLEINLHINETNTPPLSTPTGTPDNLTWQRISQIGIICKNVKSLAIAKRRSKAQVQDSTF